MSTDNYDSGGGETVQDDGTVDTKLKNRIITARKRVDEREDDLFVRSRGLKIGLSQKEACQAWGTTVRQYIRAIEPLLKSDDVKNAEHYYRQVEIGSTQVPPPDGKKEWSRFASQENPERVKQSLNLPVDFDPPEVKEVTIYGLREVLERRWLDFSWHFQLNPEQWGPAGEVEHLELTMPLPKKVLEEAVATADEFLQQAGIGLAIGKEPHGKT